MTKMINAPELAKPYVEKLAKIKVCLFDVDGILTDGRVYWAGEEVGFNRFFNILDGYGLVILKEAGIKVGIITAGDSKGVVERFKQLGVDYFFHGSHDKRAALNTIVEETGATLQEVLYMGDEFFDLPILTKVGFSATAPHASIEIRDKVDYITQREGGQACVREVIDMLRSVQNITPKIEY